MGVVAAKGTSDPGLTEADGTRVVDVAMAKGKSDLVAAKGKSDPGLTEADGTRVVDNDFLSMCHRPRTVVHQQHKRQHLPNMAHVCSMLHVASQWLGDLRVNS